MSAHRDVRQIKNPQVDVSEKKEKLFEKPVDKKAQEEEALKKLFRECFKEWCENTTSHGFGNIVRTDSWFLRFVWMLLIILFSGYCIYSI